MENNTNGNERGGFLFKNPIVESLTKSSPAISFSFYFLVLVAFIVLNFLFGLRSPFWSLVLYFSGIIFWTLFEYLMHRYFFHLESKYSILNKLVYMLHGIHHKFPRDRERMIMPPFPGLLIMGILFLIFNLIMGNLNFIFLAGIITGYLVYSFIHFSIHSFKPPFKIFRKLWMHHIDHHYKNGEKGFGVSSPLWDIIFGTMPNGENLRK